MASQQKGIPRQRGSTVILRLRGGKTPDALRADLEALAKAFDVLQDRLGQVDDMLSGRINELLLSDTLANRPTAGVTDRLFVATDQAAGSNHFWDSGTAWVLL